MKTINNSKQFVESKNRQLFDSLEKRGYKISLSFQSQGWVDEYLPWACEYIDRNEKLATIRYYDPSPKTLGFFTHELFHIDQVDKGFLTNHELDEMLPKEQTNHYPFGHINNVIAHQKFYNDFISLGYTTPEFTVDYNKDYTVEIDNDIEEIKTFFVNKTQMEDGMARFIGRFFSLIFNPDGAHKYKRQLDAFGQLDNRLYSILESHWTSWTSSSSLDNLSFFKSLFTDLDTRRADLSK